MRLWFYSYKGFAMGIYHPKEYEVRRNLHLPELSQSEKNIRRIEMLLLKNKDGFFKSHLNAHLNGLKGELDEALTAIGAKEFRGFWVHPHFYFNVRDGFTKYQCCFNAAPFEVLSITAVNLIINNVVIPVHQLMREVGIHNPENLVQLLRHYLIYEKSMASRHTVSCYLLRHFGIRHHII